MILNSFPDRCQFNALARTCNVIPVGATILADTETPVSLLAKLNGDDGPLFLLESVEGGERWGRYSFLGIAARLTVRVLRQEVEIVERGRVRRLAHQGDPFTLLRRLMARFRPACIAGLPRFWGGLVGYWSYEAASFIEAVPNRLPAQSPLAAFVMPENLLIFDNIGHSLQVLAIAVVKDPSRADEVFNQAQARIKALLHRMSAPWASAPLPANPDFALKPCMEPGRFKDRVARVKDHIRAGDIIQAVISQPFTCAQAPDPWQLYRVQRHINPSPYLFFLRIGRTTLVGSSPETMVRLENGVATLRPIAGTRPRGKDEQHDRAMADDLLADEKERAEHLMLVDLGRNDLGRVAQMGTVQVTDLMIVERYSHVMHLVSNVVCHLAPGLDAFDLLQAVFPAGTLTGAPKIRAMQIIADMEDQPRGPYGGAVGYIGFDGNMDLAITIRTACIRDGRLTVQAGAGIVADSDPAAEHQETVNKAKAMEKALQLIQRSAGESMPCWS
jgi:anthranilate synthase component 1